MSAKYIKNASGEWGYYTEDEEHHCACFDENNKRHTERSCVNHSRRYYETGIRLTDEEIRYENKLYEEENPHIFKSHWVAKSIDDLADVFVNFAYKMNKED